MGRKNLINRLLERKMSFGGKKKALFVCMVRKTQDATRVQVCFASNK